MAELPDLQTLELLTDGRVTHRDSRRWICFDTETTGLGWRYGDRICEIGCVELDNTFTPVRNFHAYINPGRPMPWDAQRVHGLSDDFLRDKPLFDEVADDLLSFVKGATLIAHNATFDENFINMELSRSGRLLLNEAGCRVVCSLRLARKLYPGFSNSLDAVSGRMGVSLARRSEHHGALLDAEILSEVYAKLCAEAARRRSEHC